jgi:hypothetical protein
MKVRMRERERENERENNVMYEQATISFQHNITFYDAARVSEKKGVM